MIEAAQPTFRSRRAKSSRMNVATDINDVEFAEPRKTRTRPMAPKVQYVEAVRKPRKRKSAKAREKIEWNLTKICWLICLLLVGRLVFMERGLIDFNSMDNTIIEKQKELQELKIENKKLAIEIKKMRTSPQYQRQITREHLGVIAKDEYLVLFSNDR